MSAPELPLELQQVQTLVAYGYKQACCRYFILTVRNASAARRFLRKLATDGWVEPATQKFDGARQTTPVSVGLTFEGLKRLGLRQRFADVLRQRARAFAQGPQTRAAQRLADTGTSASAHWDPRFGECSAHVLLALHADDVPSLHTAQRKLQLLARKAFQVAGWRQGMDGQHLSDRSQKTSDPTVHFGYVDGVSRVLVKGVKPGRIGPHEKLTVHEPGEFFLGYPNDKGCNYWMLAGERPEWSEPPPRLGEVLPPAPPQPAAFFKNASFGAFRDMAQNEPDFRRYIAANAARLDVPEAYLRAKLLGRWPNGAVVQPGQMQQPPLGGQHPSDNFDFRDDPRGEGCPFGAHVRRMNPRGDLVVPFRRRPLIRRGIPYGLPFAEGEDPDIKRGLFGLFFCANLEDQFEHLVAEWGDASPMGMNHPGDAKDPLIGNHADAAAFLDIPVKGEALSRSVSGLRPFVTTRGTLYLFFPGLNALRLMEDRHVFLQ